MVYANEGSGLRFGKGFTKASEFHHLLADLKENSPDEFYDLAEYFANLVKEDVQFLSGGRHHRLSKLLNRLIDGVKGRKKRASPPPSDNQNSLPLHADAFLYRFALFTLSVNAVSCLFSAVWLASHQIEVPQIVVILGTSSITALGGLFAPLLKKH